MGAERGLTATAGPRFFGFVIGGSSDAAVAADWLTSAWDQNSGLYVLSPALAVCEETAARWTLSLLGLPEDASVGFVTGAQMANFTALAAARGEVLRRAVQVAVEPSAVDLDMMQPTAGSKSPQAKPTRRKPS